MSSHAKIIKLNFISLEEAVKRSGLECEIDDEFKKRIHRLYEDEIPHGWHRVCEDNTVYYYEGWILGLLRTYF